MHPLNARSGIVVTPFGISTLISFEQFSNAAIPIVVTLFGISILVNSPQSIKAFDTDVSPDPITPFLI